MGRTVNQLLSVFSDPDNPVLAESADDTLSALHEALASCRPQP
jgi:hypothetical protein